MGKKSTPAAPDYTKAAEKTGASNQEAQTRADWANRPTINTPWGQESWQSKAAIDPSTGKPVTSWTQNTQLNPLSQATLDNTMKVDRDKAMLAQGMMGRAAEATGKPFDWGSMQAYGQAPQAGGLQAGYLNPGQQIGATNTQAGNLQAGNLQAGYIDPNRFQTGGAGQGIMAGLNTGGLGAMPQGDAAERQRIEGMLYDRQNPERQKQQQGLEGKLANMGLTRGSAAWNRELQRLGDQHSRERYDAMQTGGNEMARTFGMGMQQRQQGWNELLGSGQFQNAAQAQGFGQNMAQNQQNFGQGMAAGAQNFDQQARAGAQNFGQQAAAGAQNFGQNLAANAQNFGQQSQSANDWFDRQRQAGAQNFGQQAQAGQQNFSQGMDAANYNNKLRQQQIAEQQMQRQMPLNELNALLSGTQVGQLQTPDFNASRSAGGVDYSGAAGQQYNAAMDKYNARQSQTQGMMSGLGGLASTAMMFSDRRLKRDIRPAGNLPSGLPFYSYRYVWGRKRHLGVMADEAAKTFPDAVRKHWTGFLQVDYSKVS
jgi:hypothetical protein